MPVAPIVDALCISGFVLLGRESHGGDGGVTWFLLVVWPLALGWFAAAAVTRLYTSGSRAQGRLIATAATGIGAGLILRAAVTRRETPLAFVVVAFAVITTATVGWRLVAALLRRAA